jgi:hypothetical protein
MKGTVGDLSEINIPLKIGSKPIQKECRRNQDLCGSKEDE